MSAILDSVAVWTKPLEGPSPTGVPAREDERYEKLRTEIARLQSAAGEVPAWDVVEKLAGDLLATKSKDLLVASYLCGALVTKRGAQGLQAGLQAFRDICNSFWPQLYPEVDRVRARVGAITWLVEYGAKAIGRASNGAGDAEALAACEKLIGEIDTLLSERLGQLAPSVGPLRRAIEEAKSQSAPPPAAAATATAVPAAAQMAAAPSEIASDRDARSALEVAGNTLRAVASYRRKANIADASAYRLLRTGQWITLEKLPRVEAGKTLVTAPNDLKARIEALAAASDWSSLVEAAERGLRGDALFWLDLQWHVAQALRSLGHDEARRAIGQELGHLLQRVPGLEALLFRDGTPFADNRTRAWIDTECRASGGVAKPPPAPLVVPEGIPRDLLAEVEAEMGKARERLVAGQLAEGIGLLSAACRRAESRREKFLWRLAQARLLAEADRLDVARAQLEGLDEELGHVPVKEWDVPVSVDVLKALLDCHRKLGKRAKPTPESLERIRSLHERLSRLDPAAALAIEPIS